MVYGECWYVVDGVEDVEVVGCRSGRRLSGRKAGRAREEREARGGPGHRGIKGGSTEPFCIWVRQHKGKRRYPAFLTQHRQAINSRLTQGLTTSVLRLVSVQQQQYNSARRSRIHGRARKLSEQRSDFPPARHSSSGTVDSAVLILKQRWF